MYIDSKAVRINLGGLVGKRRSKQRGAPEALAGLQLPVVSDEVVPGLPPFISEPTRSVPSEVFATKDSVPSKR